MCVWGGGTATGDHGSVPVIVARTKCRQNQEPWKHEGVQRRQGWWGTEGKSVAGSTEQKNLPGFAGDVRISETCDGEFARVDAVKFELGLRNTTVSEGEALASTPLAMATPGSMEGGLGGARRPAGVETANLPGG